MEEKKDTRYSGRARADRWLWATRIFKTRSQAATACRLGQVVLGDGSEVKPSRILRPGDSLKVTRDDLTRTLDVLGVPPARVSAKLVTTYLTDRTTAEERARAEEIRSQKAANKVFRVPGEGRPTKKQLRDIQKYIEAERGES